MKKTNKLYWLLAIVILFGGGMVFGQEIAGTVSLSSVAVSNVDVLVYSESNQWTEVAQGVSGADGSYSITGLSTGQYKVYFDAGAAGGRSEWYGDKPYYKLATSVTVTNGVTSGIDIDLDSHPTGSISGIVKNSSSAGIAGVKVEVYPFGVPWPNVAGSAITDSSGIYILDGLEEGDYKLEFTAYSVGYKPVSMAGPLTVTNGQTFAATNVVLQQGGNVSGQITDSGTSAPLEGVQARAYSSVLGISVTVLTDASGNYFLGGLKAGDWSISFLGADIGYNEVYLSPDITVTEGITISGTDQALSLAGAIAGRVTTVSGVGIPGININIYNSGESWATSSTISDENGDYLVVLYAGSYDIEFSDPDNNYNTEWWDDVTNQASATPVVVVDGVHTQGVDAALSPMPGYTLWGRVTENGAPDISISDAWVSLNGAVYYSTTSDSFGFYMFNGVVSNSYTLQVDAPQDSVYVGATSAVSLTSTVKVVQQDVSLDVGASVSGRVLDDDGVGIPGGSIDIYALQDGASDPGWSPYRAGTDDDGYFTIKGLPADTYKFKFDDWSGTYKAEYYNDQTNWSSATPLTVVLGQDYTLDDATISTGPAIMGRVTNVVTGLPISGVSVYSYDQYNNQSWNPKTTDTNGEYKLTGLASGNYRIQFQGKNVGYYNEFYNDQADLASATVVTLGSVDVTGIDAGLSPGAVLSGTVTNTSGNPISGVKVDVYASNNSWYPTWTIYTDALGEYEVSIFSDDATQYKVKFDKAGYVTQWHDAKVDFNSATAVPATPLATGSSVTVSGVNAALQEAGSITGNVVDDATGLPLQWVKVYASYVTQNWTIVESAETDGNGDFTLTRLPSAEYEIKFADLAGYLTQWYHGALVYSNLTAITVTQPNQVTLLQERLIKPGTIEGTVSDATTMSVVESAYVRLYQVGVASSLAYDFTDTNGQYKFENLIPTNNYQVFYTATGYADQWYSIKATRDTADLIDVRNGQVTNNIDAVLFQRGSIAGTVTNAVTGVALYNVTVALYKADGTYMESKVTNPQGGYLFGDLEAASYLVKFTATDYTEEWFDGQSNQTSATTIVVSGTGVQIANAGLTNIGQISGTVTAEVLGTGLSGVSVAVYTPAGAYVRNGTSDANGVYGVGGLLPGTYKVYFYTPATSDYQSEWYNDKPDLAQADDVVITNVGDTVYGIDGVLARGGTINGTITDAANSQSITSAGARLYSVATGGAETYIRTSYTDAAGAYHFSGISAGDYIVRAVHGSYLPGDSGVFAVVPPGTVTRDISLSLGTSISGAVTNITTSTGLPDVFVSLYTTNGVFVKSGITDGAGAYSIPGIAAGNYAVKFDKVNYLVEWYDDQPDMASANLVTAVPPAVVSGINATMIRGGMVTGIVTDITTALPIDLATVTLYEIISGTGTVINSIYTDAAGTYSFTTLPAGDYYVSANRSTYLASNSVTFAVVPPGVITQNLALTAGTVISGKVTDSITTAGLSSVQVSLYSSGGVYLRSVSTDGSGDYSIPEIAAGNYTIRFNKAEYFLEWYDNQSDMAMATIITAAPPAAITGADASLVRGGILSGTVSNSVSGLPLDGVWVDLLGATNNVVKSGITDVNGSYRITDITTGVYKISFSKYAFVDQWYENKGSFTNATTVAIAAGDDLSGFGAALVHLGGISGRVTDSGSAGISSFKVELYNSSDAKVATTYTDVAGDYSFDLLPDGDYRVYVPASGTQYLEQWYNGKGSMASADTVTVTAPVISSGIDIVMPDGARISGVIRSVDAFANTSLVTNAYIRIYDVNNMATVLRYAYSDINGEYAFVGLLQGDYKIYVTAPSLLSRWYDGGLLVDDAAVLSLVPPANSANTDFLLPEPAQVSGRVVDSNNPSVGISNVTVSIYHSGGWWGERAISAADGSYTITGVENDDYRVEFNGRSEGYFTQYYDGETLLANATNIAVTAPQIVTLDDALLIKSGGIDGRVTNTQGEPVTNAIIRVYSTPGNTQVAWGNTDGQGYYHTELLYAGSYLVNAEPRTQEYLSTFYTNVPYLSDATAIPVVLGVNTPNVDLQLYRSAMITGLVSNIDGDPVDGVTLSLTDITVMNISHNAWTDNNGVYVFNNIWPGTYVMQYNGTGVGYIMQWYDGKGSSTNADYITLQEGDVFTNNPVMIRAGVIAGTVMSKNTALTTAAPLAGIRVRILKASDNSYVTETTTAADGTYEATTPSMITGDYIVRFYGTPAGFYDQWYPSKNTVGEAVAVSVVNEQRTSGIDADLFHPLVTASVVSGTGTVTPLIQEVNYMDPAVVAMATIPYWSPSLVMDSRYSSARSISSYDYNIGWVYEDIQVSVTYTAVPDLKVTSVAMPTNAFNGENIVVTWGLTNSGLVDAVGPWTDKVWLSTDDQIGDDVWLNNFEFSGTIPAGQSINRIQQVTIPKGVETNGEYYLVLKTDRYNQVYEGRDFEVGETNNMAVSGQSIQINITPSPDLVVSNVVAPQNAFSGQETIVGWDILNQGDGGTTTPVWYDYIYLSLDDQLDGSDVYLNRTPNGSFLPSAGSYSSTETVRMPDGVSGTYYIIIDVDGSRRVDESIITNNINAASFIVNLTPPPDLQVTSINVPVSGFSGQDINLSYTVENLGSGPSVESFWWDAVYLSTNNSLSITAGDTFLGYYYHYGELLIGASYSHNEAPILPAGISGTYYVKVWADQSGRVFEHTYANNNISVSAGMPVILQGPDLEVVDFTVNSASPILSGHPIQLSWEVENLGTAVAPNWYWRDMVYLFTNAVFDAATAIQLGEPVHYGAIEAGSNYVVSESFDLPVGLSGNYKLVVITDSRADVVELNDTNNQSVILPIVLETHTADLTAIEINGPAESNTGEAISLSWVVNNQGTGETYPEEWNDGVYITDDPTLQDPGRYLGEFKYSGVLGIEKSCTNENLVVIPFDMSSGTYYLYVIADYQHDIYEVADNYTNNISTGAVIEVTSVIADLASANIVIPAVMESGSNVVVRWTCENVGTGRTSRVDWYDRMVLSPTPDLEDPGIIYLSHIRRVGALAFGESYTGVVESTIPRELSGSYYVGVLVDEYSWVADNARSNNISWQPVTINFTPAPDLEVSQIISPATAYSSESIDISWKVTNLDADISQSWYDSVYLSRDRILDASDIEIGYTWRSGDLLAGQSYNVTKSCRIPSGISGPMYLYVVCDRRDSVFEAGRKENNVLYRTEPLLVSLPAPSDLVISSVVSATNIIMGGDIHIEYDITNQGQNETPSQWDDALYISQSSNWNADVVFLGSLSRWGSLVQGATDHKSFDGEIPGLLPGTYYIMARADVLNSVLEDNEENNITVSAQALTIDAIPLIINQPTNSLIAEGQSIYYKLDITNAGDAVLITLDGAATNAFNELYVAFGRVPSRGDFDFTYSHPFHADQEIIIPASRKGTYYILVYGNSNPAGDEIMLKAEVIPFSVLSADPASVGDYGPSTFRIVGARFTADTTFAIAYNGSTTDATRVYYRDSALAFATFDLTDADYGLYDLQASTPAGAFATLSDAFTVQAGTGARVEARINGPDTVRPSRNYLFYVNYGNIGDADGAPPILVIRTTTDTSFGYSLDTLGTEPIQILAGSSDGVAGILRPGETYTVPLYFYTDSWTVNFTVEVITSDDSTLIDWDQLESSIRPDSMSDTEWAMLWPRLKLRLGPTWGDYVRALSEVATLLSGRGEATTDVIVLFKELFNQEAGYGTAQISGTLIHAETGQLLSGITISAFDGDLADTNLTHSYISQADTDIAGKFVINDLPDGEYSLFAQGYIFTNTTKVTVEAGIDAHGIVLYGYPVPDEVVLTPLEYDDSGAAMTVDSDGVSHLVWCRSGNVWHSWRDNGAWIDAQQLTDITSTNDEQNISDLRIDAADDLLDGTNAGLIAVWSYGTGNLARVYNSIGRKKTTGSGYEWSEPEALVDQAYEDTHADITVMPSGKVLVVFQRMDAQATSSDDNDLYYAVYTMTSSGINWLAPTEVGIINNDNTIIPFDGSVGTAFDVELSGSSGNLPGLIPIIGGKDAKFSTSMQGSLQGDGCELSGSFGGTMAMNIFNRVDVKLTNTGNIGYKIKCPEAEWRFKTATLTTTGSAEAGFPLGIFEIPGDGWFINKLLTLEIGPVVGVSLSGTSGWVGGEFPGWPNSGNISMSISLGGKGVASILDDAAKGTVTLVASVTGDLMPVRKLTGTSLSLTGELESGSYKKSLNATWNWVPKDGWFGFGASSVAQDSFSESGAVYVTDTEKIVEDENGILTISVAAPILTWLPRTGLEMNYSTAEVNSVLGTGVVSNVRETGASSLAQDAGGNIFMAWTQDVDPDVVGQDGSRVAVSSFDSVAETWGIPVYIPVSLGYNSSVVAAYYGTAPMVVWSHIDTTGLDASTTVDELDTSLSVSSIKFSTFNGSIWSTTATLYAVGRNSSLTVKKIADGRVLAAWLNRPPSSDTRQLMVSFWDGTEWSTPEVLATGDLHEAPAIGIDVHSPIVMWSSDIDSAQNQAVLRMYSRTLQTNVWQATEDFTPALLTTTTVQSQDIGITGGTVPLPAPSSSCCPQKDDDDKPKPEPKPEGGGTDGYYNPRVDRPKDPNDILGPVGFGPEAWIRADEPIFYTIRFENDPEWATAPAQEVVVTQQLDADLDPRTFRVGTFGWSTNNFIPPESKAFYSTRIDLRDAYGYYVDVVAFIDTTTGIAQWHITTIDPATGQKPNDPQMGFLLPNDDNGIGEGFITYTVSAKRTAKSGDVVDAQATIVFDTESPIDTPAIFNTLDAVSPSSSVAPLPDYTATAAFNVQWSGSDDTNGSGLASYSVYMSVNGGPFTAWLENTQLTQAPFTGIKGSNYTFYCVATDNTGIRELKPVAPYIGTTAGPQTFTISYTSSPGGHITGVTVQIVDINSDGTAVTAVPDSTFVFRHWNDGSVINPRIETNVVAAINAIALFDPEVTARGVLSSWYLANGFGPAVGESWTLAQWDALDLLDPDNDGAENWEEFGAGTLPTEQASFLGMKSVEPSSPGYLNISWSSVTGHVYAVESCSDIKLGNWMPMQTNITATAPLNVLEIPLPPSDYKLYYRIMVTP